MTVAYDTMKTSQLDSISKCCCCVPLRIGCFILGYITLISNLYHTLSLLAVTTYIGLSTHWFDHFDSERIDEISDQAPQMETIERPLLIHVQIILIVILCANVVWLGINVACLVGLHKRRPGPIKVYVAFAATRLLLILSGVVYLIMPGHGNSKATASYIVDLGLAAYFILVYYFHAMQLERVQQKKEDAPVINPHNISFVTTANHDKQALVA